MLGASRIVVVVPAYLEEANVAGVVQTMPAFVDVILVVDDGSEDRTSERAAETGDPRVEVIRHPERRGVGAAITTGYREALTRTTSPTDAFCVMAGDGQMDPLELERVAGPIVRDEADYVKGNRFGDPGIRTSMGLPRYVGGQVFSRLTSAAIGVPVTDSQCGFTALSRRAALAIDLDDLWTGFGYPNDLLGQLAARRLRIGEVPVRPIYGIPGSKLRGYHLPRIGFLIARAAVRRLRRIA